MNFRFDRAPLICRKLFGGFQLAYVHTEEATRLGRLFIPNAQRTRRIGAKEIMLGNAVVEA